MRTVIALAFVFFGSMAHAYGSIAVGPTTDDFSVAFWLDAPSYENSDRGALDACRKMPGANCAIRWRFKDACFQLYYSRSLKKFYPAFAADYGTALATAATNCRREARDCAQMDFRTNQCDFHTINSFNPTASPNIAQHRAGDAQGPLFWLFIITFIGSFVAAGVMGHLFVGMGLQAKQDPYNTTTQRYFHGNWFLVLPPLTLALWLLVFAATSAAPSDLPGVFAFALLFGGSAAIYAFIKTRSLPSGPPLPRPKDPAAPVSAEDQQRAAHHLRLAEAFWNDGFTDTENIAAHFTRASREIARARALDPKATVTVTRDDETSTYTIDQLATMVLSSDAWRHELAAEKLYKLETDEIAGGKPGDGWVQRSAVYQRHRHEHIREAIAALEQALQISPHSISLHIRLVRLYAATHNPKYQAAMSRALALDPNNIELLKMTAPY